MSINNSTNVDVFDSMTERIERVRRDLELSQMAFCRRIRFPYPRYHHITGARRSKPTADLLTAVAEHTDVNPQWLLNGTGPVYRSGADETGQSADRRIPREELDAHYVLLPLYDVHGAAGDGALIDGEDLEDLLAFKRDWITRELRSSPEDLVLIHVRGESMVPTLSPGDVILVERNTGASAGDGVYVIRMGDALLVKRLQFLPEGQLDISSDNPAYQPFRVNLHEPSDEFALIGRVLWAGRRF